MSDLARRAVEKSRELALSCSSDGAIRWRDERAQHLLAEGGSTLRDLAPAEHAAVISAFLERAKNGPARVGTMLVLRHGPAAVVLHGEPYEEGVFIVASVVDASSDELAHVHEHLDDARRALLTLYDELEEKSAGLHRSAEVRSRVLSAVRHDFRTRLQAILGLTKLLLDRVDGTLTPEQDKQVRYIRTAAGALSQEVEDLLDVSAVEHGKLTVRVRPFKARELFGALRGMVAPLRAHEDVQLVFEDPGELELLTDEGKVAEVLRNLLTNALKYTSHGEVRVRARSAGTAADEIVLEVSDTGVGIPEDAQAAVFDEFTQLDDGGKARKGSGLGLPLARRLAALLAGDLALDSTPSEGSTFSLTIPRVHPEHAALRALEERAREVDPTRTPILVVEDDGQTLLLYERLLAGSGFQVLPARSVDEARAVLARMRPAAVVLDVMLEGETSWTLLRDLKSRADTADIPVLVVTVTNREEKARALGADEFFLKPLDQSWLVRRLRALAKFATVDKVLVVDDDEVSRYLMRRLLEGTPYQLIEAETAADGIRLAREHHPSVIFLDFVLDSRATAFDVLDQLRSDPVTSNIPVLIATSKDLSDEDRSRLGRETSGLLSKQSLSRDVTIRRIREILGQAAPH